MANLAAQHQAARYGEGEPMGLLEIGFLFGGLAFLIDGLSVVLIYAGFPLFAGLQCLLPFVYMAAAFMAARYTAVANGVWAAIMVAAIDTICGMVLVLLLRQADIGETAELYKLVPSSVLAVIIPLALVGLVVRVLIGGMIWGTIGGKLGQSSRPGHRP